MFKTLGPNPFDNLGVEISADGTQATPTERKDGRWVYYSDLESFSVKQQPEANREKHLPLSHWLPVYEWVANRGYDNFSSWISQSLYGAKKGLHKARCDTTQ